MEWELLILIPLETGTIQSNWRDKEKISMEEIILGRLKIRRERPEDYHEVENLTREAFWDVYCPGCSEHLVLHQLRKSKGFVPELDYVVTDGTQIIVNIVYSRSLVAAESGQRTEILTFGPISVLPSFQGKGIGKEMIRYTCEKAKSLGYKAIAITGNNHYYNPLGFQSASKYGIHLEGIPKEEEAPFFMIMELEEGGLEGCEGICVFDSAFDTNPEELACFDTAFPHKEKRESRSTGLG